MNHSTTVAPLYYTQQMQDEDNARNARITENLHKLTRMVGAAACKQSEQRIAQRQHRELRQHHIDAARIPLVDKFATPPQAA